MNPMPFFRTRFRLPSWNTLTTVVEIFSIVGLAVLFSWNYLDFDPTNSPQGRDFPLTIQSYYVWSYLGECGSCVFWNGFANGGTPAFVEVHGAFLHPLVILTTLIWGVINGAKVTLVVCFVLAGLGQWWLARAMNLHLAARLWAGAMAVVGGYLATRMESGLVAIILATAFAVLSLPAIFLLGWTGKRQYALLTGIFVALTMLSGQGYIQISFFVALLCATILFCVKLPFSIQPVWKEFFIASGIALLLTGVFWVPFLHFYPNFAKDTDPFFLYSQPFEYQPLNMVIQDFTFYKTGQLGMALAPYPSLYMNYIGWFAVFLVFVGLYYLHRLPVSQQGFLLFPPFLILLISSRQGLQFLAHFAPDLIAQLRYPSLMVGLVTPFLLGLAAYGLDQLMRQSWMVLNLSRPFGKIKIALPLLQFALILLAGFSLKSIYKVSQVWLFPGKISSEATQVVEYLKTDHAQWVQPTPEAYWYPLLFENGIKGIYIIRPWHWRDRVFPPPNRISMRSDDPNIPSNVYIHQFHIIHTDFNQYAAINIGDRLIPCSATSQGGHINVHCSSKESGVLTVQENYWTGWKAFLDGNPIPLHASPWLQVDAPAGSHSYSFRYQPWDVPLGMFFTGLGLCLVLWLWRKAPK